MRPLRLDLCAVDAAPLSSRCLKPCSPSRLPAGQLFFARRAPQNYLRSPTVRTPLPAGYFQSGSPDKADSTPVIQESQGIFCTYENSPRRCRPSPVQPRWPERVSISESPASDKRNRYGSAVTNGRSQRWQERDPWGLPVECAEDVWEKKAQQHPEIVANEEAIRAALRNPDALYYDPDATAGLRNAGLPEGQRGAVMRYVGPGAVQTTHGLTPMLMSIAVKV